MKKVTMRELVSKRIVLAVCAAVYYWCWARSGWHEYYGTIQLCVGTFALCFFVMLAARERKYKKETADEMAVTNLRRCDSVCLKIATAAILVIGFLCAVLRFAITTEIIGYMLMALLLAISVIRTVLFCLMDAKGV